ncbi:SinI family restriction endonuclease [Picosynechococcus sp. PCC 73109]|uniref:SinI family restriction endonuclease n=1 Tax=Picosynechococcus sp. PCC 73109 TaxID=374982 RepID=UPI0012EDBDD4|nr:SinI family restriction endonuclease [Picosynechococcus sp. PCC 73109]
MVFNRQLAKTIAENELDKYDDKEQALVRQFIDICTFLSEFPDQLSWRTSKKNPEKPDVNKEEGLNVLASCYFSAYRRSQYRTKSLKRIEGEGLMEISTNQSSPHESD